MGWRWCSASCCTHSRRKSTAASTSSSAAWWRAASPTASTAFGCMHERLHRRLACAGGARGRGRYSQPDLAHAGPMVRRRARRGLGTSGVGKGGGNRDPRRRHRSNPGAAAGRARQRSGFVALWRAGSRLHRFHADASIDLCRRAVRGNRHARRQMVAGLSRVPTTIAMARYSARVGRNAGMKNMVRESEIRDGELAVDMPAARDAGLVFIGRIRTPWTSRLATPRQGRHDGPVCRLEIFEPWVPAIKGVDFYSNLEVIYWLHQSRRDLVLQSPKNNKSTRGTFSLRSPVRPNPIATSVVKLVGIEGNVVLVRGLDCLDETPLLDIKPDRCEFTPLAPPQPGDFETE